MNPKLARLSIEERVVIQTLLGEKRSVSYIAERLGRNRSSIHREVRKWVVNPKDRYDARIAHFAAKDDYQNKRNLDKINSHPRLREFVYSQLERRLSPEQIAGRLKEIFPDDPVMSISHEAIYQHILSQPAVKTWKTSHIASALFPFQKAQKEKDSQKEKPGPRYKKN